jgi:hypothetical protein
MAKLFHDGPLVDVEFGRERQKPACGDDAFRRFPFRNLPLWQLGILVTLLIFFCRAQ